jgi:glutathione S-transferase
LGRVRRIRRNDPTAADHHDDPLAGNHLRLIRLRATPRDRFEQERQNRAYLVGEALSVADLTVAALLGVLLQPSEIQYPLQVALPLCLKDYRATLLRHSAAQWAAGIYGCIADTPRKLPRARLRRSILEK